MTPEACFLGWPRLVVAFPRLAAIYDLAGEHTRAQLRAAVVQQDGELGTEFRAVLDVLDHRN